MWSENNASAQELVRILRDVSCSSSIAAFVTARARCSQADDESCECFAASGCCCRGSQRGACTGAWPCSGQGNPREMCITSQQSTFPHTFPTKSFAASHGSWLARGDPAGCLLGSLSFPSGQHGAAFHTLILGAAMTAARAFVTQLWSRALGTLGVLCTYRAQSRATSPGLGVLLPLLPSRVSAQNSVAGG